MPNDKRFEESLGKLANFLEETAGQDDDEFPSLEDLREDFYAEGLDLNKMAGDFRAYLQSRSFDERAAACASHSVDDPAQASQQSSATGNRVLSIAEIFGLYRNSDPAEVGAPRLEAEIIPLVSTNSSADHIATDGAVIDDSERFVMAAADDVVSLDDAAPNDVPRRSPVEFASVSTRHGPLRFFEDGSSVYVAIPVDRAVSQITFCGETIATVPSGYDNKYLVESLSPREAETLVRRWKRKPATDDMFWD